MMLWAFQKVIWEPNGSVVDSVVYCLFAADRQPEYVYKNVWIKIVPTQRVFDFISS